MSEEFDRSTRMATISHRGGEDSERSAVKRCFSPGSPGSWDVKRNRSRKHKPDPLLVVLQRGVLKREGEERAAKIQTTDTDTDVIGSFGATSSGHGTVVEVEVRRHNSLPTPTLAMVETEILGSLDSHTADLGTPLDWLVTSSCLWSQTCSSNSRLSPSLSSPGLSTEGPRWPLSSMSRQEASLTSFSSSYTSWTQPEVGRQQSDSCVPASSILDMPEDSPPEAGRRSRSRSRSPRIQPRQRNRSADTSKDISEIDDLELDVLENQFDIELPHDDEERNKNQWKVKSPDLAYSSMEPSRQAEP